MEEYIYHYTSIETLSQILKHKNIRFNSLKNVDDINETQFSDENRINLSSHTLISCWTNSGEENLAFWNMYTPNMKGVRIKLSKELFRKYRYTTDGVPGIQVSVVENSLVPKAEAFHKDYWLFTMSDHFFNVEYTDNESLLKPQIYKEEGTQYILSVGEIGKYKSTIWKFQEEVRFRLFVLPTKDMFGNSINPISDFKRILTEQIPPSTHDYFINILDHVFENMEITLGPKCSSAEQIIVEALIAKYNPNAKLIVNRFQGLIR